MNKMSFSRHINRTIKEIEKYFFDYDYKISTDFDSIIIQVEQPVYNYDEIKKCVYYKSSCLFCIENREVFYFKSYIF